LEYFKQAKIQRMKKVFKTFETLLNEALSTLSEHSKMSGILKPIQQNKSKELL
jgi:hypothetical protein